MTYIALLSIIILAVFITITFQIRERAIEIARNTEWSILSFDEGTKLEIINLFVIQCLISLPVIIISLSGDVVVKIWILLLMFSPSIFFVMFLRHIALKVLLFNESYWVVIRFMRNPKRYSLLGTSIRGSLSVYNIKLEAPNGDKVVIPKRMINHMWLVEAIRKKNK